MGNRLVRVAFLISTLLVLPLMFCSIRILAQQPTETNVSTAPSTEGERGLVFYWAASPYEGNGRVESISVSKSGWFLMAFSDSNKHFINVYDNWGRFQKGCVIEKEYGSVIATFDGSNNIGVVPIRRDTLYVLGLGTENVQLSSYPFTPDYEWTSRLSGLNSFRYEVAGNKYVYNYKWSLLFAGGQRDFSVTDATGHELFHYKNEFNSDSRNFLIAFFVAGFGVFIFTIYQKEMRSKA